ncbi:MAG TPA: FHA domain-containing protein [Methylotenera sp.]|nr:FHA domain-containing protein [Methylotenera sp.]
MAKLILSLENKFLSEHQLNNERTTIGRRPTNDIHIDNLAVSGLHAAILKMGNDFYVEDQGSTNGTQVNAKLIKNHLLQDGDLIDFGKHQLKYVNDALSNNNDNGFEKTMFMHQESMNALPSEQDDKPNLDPVDAVSIPVEDAPEVVAETPSVNVPAQPLTSSSSDSVQGFGKIKVLNGSNNGRELVLNKALITLGKPGVQVAVITKRSSGYFITHVEGQVYPILNGASIGAHAHALKDHDLIEVAGVKMEFYLS